MGFDVCDASLYATEPYCEGAFGILESVSVNWGEVGE